MLLTEKFNAKGARIYPDPMMHEELKIPRIKTVKEKGSVYTVLSVGLLKGLPVVSVKTVRGPILYRLPSWYTNWAMDSVLLSESGSEFPSEVEFGFIEEDGTYYAEIIGDTNDT